MSATRVTAWTLAVASVVASVLAFAGLGPSGVDDPDAWDIVSAVLFVMGTTAPACVGAVLLARRPGTRRADPARRGLVHMDEIIGGTGRYQGASGHIVSKEVASGTDIVARVRIP